jgi:glycosyltransferase involved in cell wall biosynthesis
MRQSECVSVVIPCFNQGAFLAEAIDSALAQDIGCKEIVVIDDGSTDETRAVLARYPELLVLERPHAGVAAARNAGLAASSGAYVVFLDADDRLVPGALDATLQVLEADPACAFAAGHHRRIDAQGQPLPDPAPPVAAADLYELLLRGNCLHTATVMYRRGPLVQAGGFDPALEVCEDWELYLRLARRLPARLHGRIVAEYRRYGAQTTARRLELLLKSGLAVLRAQRPLLVDARERAAWRAGARFWREHYGDLLLAAIRVDLREHRFAQAARRATALACHAPAHTGRRLARAVLRRLRGGRR